MVSIISNFENYSIAIVPFFPVYFSYNLSKVIVTLVESNIKLLTTIKQLNKRAKEFIFDIFKGNKYFIVI